MRFLRVTPGADNTTTARSRCTLMSIQEPGLGCSVAVRWSAASPPATPRAGGTFLSYRSFVAPGEMNASLNSHSVHLVTLQWFIRNAEDLSALIRLQQFNRSE